MPGTRKIDDRYNVTISSERRRGGGWRAEGDICVAGTDKWVGVTVEGEGSTMSAAEERAFAAARHWCLTHWIGRKRRSTEHR
jgi:hypothetical protein